MKEPLNKSASRDAVENEVVADIALNGDAEEWRRIDPRVALVQEMPSVDVAPSAEVVGKRAGASGRSNAVYVSLYDDYFSELEPAEMLELELKIGERPCGAVTFTISRSPDSESLTEALVTAFCREWQAIRIDPGALPR